MSRRFFRTRKAKVNDYSACLPLFSLLYHGDIGAHFKHTFTGFVENDNGVILLAEDAYKVVGILVGSYHLDIDWEGRIARIDALIVDEACRRTGIGRELVSQFIAMAEGKNCRAVKSRINTKNAVAQRFHESLDFTRANTYEYFLDFQERRKQ